MAGAGVGAGLGLSGFLAVEGLKNAASAVGNPAARLMVMGFGRPTLGEFGRCRALQDHRRYRWRCDWEGRLIVSAAANGPRLEANWHRRGFNLVSEMRYRLVQEEYRPRWGARSSKPLGGAKASPVGSNSCLFRHSPISGRLSLSRISLKATVYGRCASPLVSRHIVLSQHEWGNKVGNGGTLPPSSPNRKRGSAMARTGKLSAVEVAKAKGPAVLHDGGGLYLRVSATGAKSWVFRFQLDGKRRDMGLGPYPDISLAEARGKASAHRKQRHDGIDPLDAKEAQRQAQRVSVAKGRTFRECAVEFIEKNRAGWRNAKHRQQWENTLANLRLPHIGGIARLGDRCRACRAGARSDLDREAGNGKPGAGPHRGGARRRDRAGLSAGAEPGTCGKAISRISCRPAPRCGRSRIMPHCPSTICPASLPLCGAARACRRGRWNSRS